jgi:mediator of RNA polymerase II transcription subunit 12, fungi type
VSQICDWEDIHSSEPEVPFDPKAVPFDPFRNYPNKQVSELPLDLPREYRRQLASLLPHFPSVSSVSNLVNYHRDVAGNIEYVTPVVNRPWEWIENLGDPTAIDPKGDEREGEKIALKTKSLVKNSGSLSLDTFNARMTGDGILRNSRDDTQMEGNLRLFQDGLAGENVFKRDWWETRISLDAKLLPGTPADRVGGEVDQEVGGIVGNPGTSNERRMTPRGSPSSVVSRSSARGSTASIRQSPAQGLVHRRSSSTTSDVIDVDSITTTVLSSKRGSSNKRKVAAITVSDDEIEIIEGPLAQASVKRTKAKAPTKAKNKKK